MSLLDRDYMRDPPPRPTGNAPRPAIRSTLPWAARLRFGLWLLWRKIFRKDRPRNRITVLTVLLALVLAASGQLLICERCGREYAPDDEICGHCGALLESAQPAPSPPLPEPPVESDVGPAASARLLAQREAAAAAEALRAGEPALALLHARQASAFAAAGEDEALLEALPRLHAAVRDGLRRRTQVCPLCDGQRIRKILAVTMSREVIEMDAPGQFCPLCRGRGRIAQLLTAPNLQATMARALAAFHQEQSARGHVRRGDLWLPPELDADWPVRERAAALVAANTHCSDCHGLGFTGCTRCGGAGRIPCPNGSCVMGMTVCPACEGSGREDVLVGARPVNRRCSRCNTRGVAACPECEGNGFLDCAHCRGSAQAACRRCGGSGLAEPCRRCDSSGLTPCRRCGGAGTYRGAECSLCGGEGVSLCPTCAGAGHRHR